MVILILTVAWADGIASLLTRSTPATDDRSVLIVLIVCATFSFWISAQSMQVGLRALISDHCAPSEQIRARAWAGSYSN